MSHRDRHENSSQRSPSRRRYRSSSSERSSPRLPRRVLRNLQEDENSYALNFLIDKLKENERLRRERDEARDERDDFERELEEANEKIRTLELAPCSLQYGVHRRGQERGIPSAMRDGGNGRRQKPQEEIRWELLGGNGGGGRQPDPNFE